MRILVIGSTGMLGNAVGTSLIEKYGEENVYLTYRNSSVAYGKNKIYFSPLENGKSDMMSFLVERLFYEIGKIDWVINCIGTIKPHFLKNPIDSIKLNSIFPRELANESKIRKSKLINISTDCVYSGFKGTYTENDPHDALDDYGKSKSLGEPNNCMTIRTSIIGEEIHNNASLIEWAKSQKDKPVNGFTNHLWNGMTTKEYANVCSQIIDNNLYTEGVSHLFSNTLTKYGLLGLINQRFNLNMKITATEAKETIDRTLATVKPLQNQVTIRTLERQIITM